MSHSVAPINAVACNKSKAVFRLPTVRRSRRRGGEGIVMGGNKIYTKKKGRVLLLLENFRKG
jgi:hypothetical protein